MKTYSAPVFPGILVRLGGLLSALFPARQGKDTTRSGSPRDLTGPAAIIAGTLPDDFEAFTAVEIAEARELFRGIVADRDEIGTLLEEPIRKAYKLHPGGPEDSPLSHRLQQAAVLRSLVKARRNSRCELLGNVLRPGLNRAADAVERTLEDLAESERAMAENLGLIYEEGQVCKAIRSAHALLRAVAKDGAAGSARDLSAGTFGLIRE